MRGKVASLMLFALLFLHPHAEATAKVYRIKVATLMPNGTAWMSYLNRFAANVKKKTNNTVRFVFYAGGVAGDERDAIRKMRTGQIQAVAVTSMGLSLILPTVRIQELPLLFRSYKEFQYVSKGLQPTLNAMFEAKGYQMLSWAPSGWVYLFTHKPIRNEPELKRAKIWRWVDDFMVQAIFKELGIRGVPLGVPDVLSSLQSGIIDCVYGMPQAVLALQWHTNLKYVIDIKMNMAVGGLLMKKDVFDSMPGPFRKKVLVEAAALQKALFTSSVQVNNQSMRQMIRAGMIRIAPPAALLNLLKGAARQVYTKFTDKIYSKSMLIQLQQLLKRCRATKCAI